jgi:hypothetical protein
MALYAVKALPDAALAAAALFHANHLPLIQLALATLDETLTIIFPPADHTHRGWRLAVVQELARTYAPQRINAVASDSEAVIAAAVRYLEAAAGVTGQSLMLVGEGAGAVLSSDP